MISARPEYHRDSTENGRFGEIQHRKMLAGIDLDLEAQPDRRYVLGQEPVAERHPALRLLPPRFAEPGVERVSQGVQHRTCRPGLYLNQIDILGVPRGRRQVELVERGTAAEGERPGENRIREYLDQGPADDEVLLDLEVLVPGRLRPPLGDVVPWDHASASMLAFTNSRQSCDRGASVASAPGRSFV